MSEFAILYKTDTRLQSRKNNILNADRDARLYEFCVNYILTNVVQVRIS